MKIVILGAGQVGGTLAASLSSEKKMDITVVDSNAHALRELRDKYDIGTITGHAAHPDILHSAGIEDADILVAVTGSDEVNIVACQISHLLHHTPTKICRIRSNGYVKCDALFQENALPIDVIISPETLVTQHIMGLLKYPGALQVLTFANGLAQLVGIRAHAGDKYIGNTLAEIKEMTPKQDVRVAAIFRSERAIEPKRTTELEPLDEVFYIAAKKNIRPIMQELGQLDRPYRRIMIAGGGNIGKQLAASIEDQYNVKIIERSSTRAEELAEELDKTIVLHGSASDSELLYNENIDKIDVYIALTNDDEANIMSSLLAKKLGARTVITLITNPAYVDVVQGADIDIAFSPQQITLGSLLKHVRRGDTASVHSLRRGAAEALEIIAHGDNKTSKVVGRKVSELNLPEGARIGALVREEEVIVAYQDLVIEPEDHVIIFMADKTQIPAVETLFQVGFGFF